MEVVREIVLDTETTGLDPASGHRVVEVACLELINRLPTGKTFHSYLNPEREVPAEVVAIHGLTDEFLADKPLFAEVAEDFLAFIGDSALVAHNAGFDLRFLNAELTRLEMPALEGERAVDTVALARRKFPGAPAKLDDLCRRFDIDTSKRSLHGALIDCELLAEVYLELCGGRQIGLGLGADEETTATTVEAMASSTGTRSRREPRPHAASAEEKARHRAFLQRHVAGLAWPGDG